MQASLFSSEQTIAASCLSVSASASTTFTTLGGGRGGPGDSKVSTFFSCAHILSQHLSHFRCAKAGATSQQ